MSASLVGSEMCIRDSCHAVLCRAPLRSCVASLRFASLRVLARLLARRPAVSYTHLTLPTICSV
eukprot:13646103-Alexandrium_andersonii.AAC.1